MTLASRLAWGFAIFRGAQLAALTVPWILAKVRAADATPAERALVRMVGSRSILLGLAMVLLALLDRRPFLGGLLLADALLQLFDAVHALALHQRRVAVLPAALCVLDACAGAVLLG